jgi:nucleotidyltransferase/DNA polymerase involved in DNA repair
MIIAVSLPDFLISLEEGNHPETKDRPMVIYELKGTRRTVIALSLEAKQRGISVGMSKTRAYGLCPEVVEVENHSAYYRHLADALCTELLVYSDRIEREIISGLTIWLDLGKRTHTDSLKLASSILEFCCHHAPTVCSVGGATGRSTARITALMTRTGHHQILSPDCEQRFLSRVAIAQFQATKRFHEQCERFGLTYLSDLGALPYSAVKTRLGDEGAHLHRLYHGFDRTTIEQFSVPLCESVSRVFDLPIEDKTILLRLLFVLAEELSARLKTKSLVTNEVTLRLACDDKSSVLATRTLRTPLQQTKALAEELERLLSQLIVTSGIVSLSVLLDRLTPPTPHQLDFFDNLFGASQPFIETAVEHLAVRHEATPLVRIGVPTERSLLPERNCIFTPANVA